MEEEREGGRRRGIVLIITIEGKDSTRERGRWEARYNGLLGRIVQRIITDVRGQIQRLRNRVSIGTLCLPPPYPRLELEKGGRRLLLALGYSGQGRLPQPAPTPAPLPQLPRVKD
uniref:Uncharacterized protein n=1 Tax=Oryza nivara TaxID=4536 RepID=A0A0E0GFU3_ORYNI